MNTTRTGKIARLPRHLRDQIGIRLANGEPGPKIVEWLNTHESVRDALEEYFDGRPITEKNLSEWRQGGHQDWLRLQEKRTLAGQLAEDIEAVAETVDADAVHQRLSDNFASVFAVEFVKLAQTMLREDLDTKQRWAAMCDIHLQLSRLRRDDCRSSRNTIQRQRWTRQVEAEDEAVEKARDAEIRRKRVLRLRLGDVLTHEAKNFGGDDIGHDIAAFALEQEFDLKHGALGRKSEKFALNPSEGRVTRVPKMDPSAPSPAPESPTIASHSSPASPKSHPSVTAAPAEMETPPAPPNTPESSVAPQDSSDVPTPSDSTALNPSDNPLPPDAIPLANDCTPEEFSSRRKKPNSRSPRHAVDSRCRPTIHKTDSRPDLSRRSLGEGEKTQQM